MNSYLVRTKDEREYVEPVLDDGSGPSIPWWPTAPVVAETPAQAKHLFIREFTSGRRLGVETDDYPNLRVRLLSRDVGGTPGVRTDAASWLRVHEVLDHDGEACDCPELESQL